MPGKPIRGEVHQRPGARRGSRDNPSGDEQRFEALPDRVLGQGLQGLPGRSRIRGHHVAQTVWQRGRPLEIAHHQGAQVSAEVLLLQSHYLGRGEGLGCAAGQYPVHGGGGRADASPGPAVTDGGKNLPDLQDQGVVPRVGAVDQRKEPLVQYRHPVLDPGIASVTLAERNSDGWFGVTRVGEAQQGIGQAFIRGREFLPGNVGLQVCHRLEEWNARPVRGAEMGEQFLDPPLLLSQPVAFSGSGVRQPAEFLIRDQVPGRHHLGNVRGIRDLAEEFVLQGGLRSGQGGCRGGRETQHDGVGQQSEHLGQQPAPRPEQVMAFVQDDHQVLRGCELGHQGSSVRVQTSQLRAPTGVVPEIGKCLIGQAANLRRSGLPLAANGDVRAENHTGAS